MYNRILSRLTAPLLLSETKYKDIQFAVMEPIFLGEKPGSITKTVIEGLSLDGTTAIVPIKGTLVSGTEIGDSGATSYSSISSNIKRAIEAGAKNLVFNIASYGGEADGAIGLAKYIQSLPELYSVKTIGLVDGPCCSAGYLLASGMQEILVTQSAELGSIGAIASIPNYVDADKKVGVKWTTIRSHSEKALGGSHEVLTDEAIASIQKKVDNIAALMIDTITSGRPKLSKDTIVTLNGRTVFGNEAISIGLADKLIESVDISLEMIKRGYKPMSDNTNSSGINLEEVVKLKSELETTKQAMSLAVTKATADERNRILGIIDASKTFGLSVDVAVKQINLNSTVEQSVAMFEAVKEAIQMANPTPVTTQTTGQIKESSTNPFDMWIAGNEYLTSMK